MFIHIFIYILHEHKIIKRNTQHLLDSYVLFGCFTFVRSRGYIFSCLTQQILCVHNYKIYQEPKHFSGSDKSRMLVFLLINVGILTFMSRKKFMFSCVEHEILTSKSDNSKNIL